MLSSRFIKIDLNKTAISSHNSKDSRLFKFIDHYYTRMLEWSMGHRRTIVALCVFVSLSTVPLLIVIGKDFIPDDDRSAFQISLRAPEGTSLAAMLTITERVARDVRGLPGVSATLSSIGSTSAGFGVSTGNSSNGSSIYVALVPATQRKLSQQKLTIMVRDLFRAYPPDLHTSITAAGGTNGGVPGVQYVITGPELSKLNEYSQLMMAKLKTIPYTTDVDSSLEFGKPELHIDIDRTRAADLGVRVNDVAQALKHTGWWPSRFYLLFWRRAVRRPLAGSEGVSYEYRRAISANGILCESARVGPS